MLLTKRRSDGKYIKDLSPYYKLIPYVMPSTNDAVIFYKLQCDITAALEYIDSKKCASGASLTLFHVMIAALLHLGVRMPSLNRFVSGKRIYIRNELSVSFTMAMGDGKSDSYARVTMDPGMSLADVSAKILAAIHDKRGKPGEERARGRDALDFFVKLPRWVLSTGIKALRIFDHYGMFTKTIAELLPTYCSVYVANLGYYGVDAPFHHNFDFGSASVFVTMGNIHKEWITTRDLKFELRDVVNFAFTIDERVISGGEAARAVRLFRELIEDPRALETPPAEVQP